MNFIKINSLMCRTTVHCKDCTLRKRGVSCDLYKIKHPYKSQYELLKWYLNNRKSKEVKRVISQLNRRNNF